MICNYYIRKILNDSQISEVKKIIDLANQNDSWEDGLNSGGGFSSVKKNTELYDFELSKKINSMIMKSLDCDRKFISFTCAKETGTNIISRTQSGNYYNPHMDNWNNGDYSTTVFLNGPDEYDGGELCLYFGNDGEKKVKLDAGWGITYSTGTLHRVNEVISGTRYASVFWTKSLVQNSEIRSIIYQIDTAKEIIEQCASPVHMTTCDSAFKDPVFILSNVKNELLRHYNK